MKPEKEFKVDAVSASVWPREVNGSNGTFTDFLVKIEKSYLDKAGQWQHTNNFRMEDLPKVVLVANEAYRFIALKERIPESNPKNSISNEENVL